MISQGKKQRFRRATLQSLWWKTYQTIKFCGFCGGKLIRHYVAEEKKKRLVCRQCRRITYENPKVVAATLPIRRGKIYLLRRAIEPARGKWTYPAGYAELGESVEEAAIRETREEICTSVKLKKLFGVYSYRDSGVVTFIYLAQVTGTPSAGVESLEVTAFSLHEIPWKDLAFRSTKDALTDLKSWARRS